MYILYWRRVLLYTIKWFHTTTLLCLSHVIRINVSTGCCVLLSWLRILKFDRAVVRIVEVCDVGELWSGTLPEHSSESPVFSGVDIAWSLGFCVVFYTSLFCHFNLFIFAIVLYVLLLSKYPLGIFKLFLYCLTTVFYFQLEVIYLQESYGSGLVLYYSRRLLVWSHTE
jgi:hypothetical protein